MKGPHGAAGKNQLHPSPAASTSSDVFSITGHHRAIDLLCLMETWYDADSAVLSCLHGAAYNVIDRARPCTADELSVNHGSIGIVAGADIASSPVDIADAPSTFEIVCAAHVLVSAISLRSSSCCIGLARRRCSSSRHSLTN